MIEISLDGIWKCRPDNSDEGLIKEWFNPKNLTPKDLIDIKVPNSFNTLKGYEAFEGVFWYYYEFTFDSEVSEDKDFLLRFKGSNYLTKVWVNGEYIGENEGGFVPFYLKITNFLKSKKNFIAVRTDNIRRKSQLPDVGFDWFNWGGIYRSVDLLILNKNRITDVVIKTLLPSRKESQLNVSYRILGIVSVKWKILDTDKTSVLLEGNASNLIGKAGFTATLKNPKLWSPETPNLYYLELTYTSSETPKEATFKTQFGVREIKTNGPYIYLNKKKLYMKGVCLHEEYMPFGRSIPYEKREEDIKNMKLLGLNALRTAHYSHDEDLMDISDKLGMLILEEIPVYWFCDYKNKETFRLGARMMRRLIKRDINHPCVILWSVGNEVPIQQIACLRFFRQMMEWTRILDDTRIVTYVSHRMFCDLTRRKADVACFNGYFGWYYGSPRMISTLVDVMRTAAFNRPWLYTEFGAGGKFGYRPGYEHQEKFSEERQLYVLDHTIRTLNSKDFIAGWFIWVYRDFRSFLRQNEYQQGFNRKGLVSGERNEKKLIFHRLPKIIHQSRKVLNTKVIGIAAWLILFPFAYLITFVTDFFMGSGQRKRMDAGKQIELERYKNKKII